jgi:hypothetical protein
MNKVKEYDNLVDIGVDGRIMPTQILVILLAFVNWILWLITGISDDLL